MKRIIAVTLGLPALLALFAGAAFAYDGYYGGPNVSYHASTAGEGYQRGLANVISAQGDYNLSTSQAAINMTQAQSQEIQNRMQYTQTYFDMRRVNEQYTKEHRTPRPTAEDMARYAQMGKPARLGPAELDYVSGKIGWPSVLRENAFEDNRKALDELFAKRAYAGGVSSEQSMQIRSTTNAMLDTLKRQIRDLVPSDYTTARKFLVSLAYEGTLPVASMLERGASKGS